VGYYLTIPAPKASTRPPEICRARCVQKEASRQIAAQQDARIVQLVVSLLVLHRRSAKLVLWGISQRHREQLFALRVVKATAQTSLVKHNVPSVLLENLLREQRHLYVKIAMLDPTPKKERLNVVSVVQGPMRIFLHPLALCAQLESTNSLWE
jgi:hypothetical protein